MQPAMTRVSTEVMAVSYTTTELSHVRAVLDKAYTHEKWLTQPGSLYQIRLSFQDMGVYSRIHKEAYLV